MAIGFDLQRASSAGEQHCAVAGDRLIARLEYQLVGIHNQLAAAQCEPALDECGEAYHLGDASEGDPLQRAVEL